VANQVEIETTLAVCSESPDRMVGEVANLTEVGPYSLTPGPDIAIRDVYLDLPDRSLRSLGFGLRLRLVDGDQLITLKGRARDVSGGGLRREEIELAWSPEAIDLIVGRLAESGLTLTPPCSANEWHEPHTIVSLMGLATDHTRSTVRRPREVSTCDEPPTVVAELVIDSVVFFLEFGPVRHHEIEVEAKGVGTIENIQEVSNTLLAGWPDSLREWHFGKRSTGRAVDSLLAEHGPYGIVSASGDLLPGAYDLIHSRLQ
jgi:hypothetical protein